MAVSVCRRCTIPRTALTGQLLTSLRKILVTPSWLQVKIAQKVILPWSSAMEISDQLLDCALEIIELHTVELEALAAVQKSAIAETDVSQCSNFIDLCILAIFIWMATARITFLGSSSQLTLRLFGST